MMCCDDDAIIVDIDTHFFYTFNRPTVFEDSSNFILCLLWFYFGFSPVAFLLLIL
jgi:hypothetical protein